MCLPPSQQSWLDISSGLEPIARLQVHLPEELAGKLKASESATVATEFIESRTYYPVHNVIA